MVNLQNETWKNIIGYTNYRVSNMGRIKSINKITTKETILKPILNQDGYSRVGLWIEKKKTFKFVHRLVAEHFILNPDNKKYVSRKLGIKNDNRASELFWSTQDESELNTSKLCLKTPSPGIKNGRSKLTEENVREIRKLDAEKIHTRTGIAEKFKVDAKVIRNIINKKNWSHVI